MLTHVRCVQLLKGGYSSLVMIPCFNHWNATFLNTEVNRDPKANKRRDPLSSREFSEIARDFRGKSLVLLRLKSINSLHKILQFFACGSFLHDVPSSFHKSTNLICLNCEKVYKRKQSIWLLKKFNFLSNQMIWWVMNLTREHCRKSEIILNYWLIEY